jgi:hypothetical protein
VILGLHESQYSLQQHLSAVDHPRRRPRVIPVAIDWIAPAPGETLIATDAPMKASHISHRIGRLSTGPTSMRN